MPFSASNQVELCIVPGADHLSVLDGLYSCVVALMRTIRRAHSQREKIDSQGATIDNKWQIADALQHPNHGWYREHGGDE